MLTFSCAMDSFLGCLATCGSWTSNYGYEVLSTALFSFFLSYSDIHSKSGWVEESYCPMVHLVSLSLVVSVMRGLFSGIHELWGLVWPLPSSFLTYSVVVCLLGSIPFMPNKSLVHESCLNSCAGKIIDALVVLPLLGLQKKHENAVAEVLCTF